jgi:hypothetical protein
MRPRLAVLVAILLSSGLVGMGAFGVLALHGCQQTFVSPAQPDLYKSPHDYDLAVPLAETGEDLAVAQDLSGARDLKTAADLAKPDSDAGL